MENVTLYRVINYYYKATIPFDIIVFILSISVLLNNLNKNYITYYLICHIGFLLICLIIKIVNLINKLKLIIFKCVLLFIQILFTICGYFIWYYLNMNHSSYFLSFLLIYSISITIFFIIYICFKKMNKQINKKNNNNHILCNTETHDNSVSYKINDSFSEPDKDNILMINHDNNTNCD